MACGFPAITTSRLLEPLTQFTDNKTEAKKGRDLPKATKPKAGGMDLPRPIPAEIWPKQVPIGS